jgi:multidrug efflux pump subunit AcrB
MSLSTLSIKRPVFTIVINLAIVLFGIIGYTYLGVREFPSIDPAQISIRTNYTGANADIIESQITEPLEKAIIQSNLIWIKIWKKPQTMFVIKFRKPFVVCHKILMRRQ